MSSPSFAESPTSPRAGRYELQGRVSYFSTDSNYADGDATAVPVIADGEYTNALGQFQFVYDFRSDARAFAGVSGAWAESYDGSFSRSNSGLNEAWVGGQYWIRPGAFILIPEAELAYPLFRIDEDSDEALLGEGVLRARAGSWLQMRWGPLIPFGYLGAEYRDDGRSSLAHYNIGLRIQQGRSWWLEGAFRGFESITDDKDTDNRAPRGFFLNRVNGGSYRYYGVNPALSEVALEGGVSFGGLRLLGGFAKTMNGVSSADGWTVMGGLAYSPPPPRKKEFEEEDRFDIKREEYDESLFEEPTEDKKPEWQEGDPAELQQKVPAKRRIKRKVRKKPAVDKLLQETERELEN